MRRAKTARQGNSADGAPAQSQSGVARFIQQWQNLIVATPAMPRKNLRRSVIIVLDPDKGHNGRVAVAPRDRHLDFGEKWSYAPAPEAHDYIKLQPRYQLFIGGRFVAPKS